MRPAPSGAHGLGSHYTRGPRQPRTRLSLGSWTSSHCMCGPKLAVGVTPGGIVGKVRIDNVALAGIKCDGCWAQPCPLTALCLPVPQSRHQQGPFLRDARGPEEEGLLHKETLSLAPRRLQGRTPVSGSANRSDGRTAPSCPHCQHISLSCHTMSKRERGPATGNTNLFFLSNTECC